MTTEESAEFKQLEVWLDESIKEYNNLRQEIIELKRRMHILEEDQRHFKDLNYGTAKARR